MGGLKNFAGKNAALGLVRGAADIGETLQYALNPFEWGTGARERRNAGIEGAMDTLGAEKDSMLYGSGRLTANIAGTAGVGGALGGSVNALANTAGAGARVAPVVNALSSSGFTTGRAAAPGAAGFAANQLTRAGAGAAVGGASAGLIDPSSAGIGAMIGGALPGVLQLAGAAGNAVGRGASAVGDKVRSSLAPEVTALAKRAKELGIDIPADRILQSKSLDAVAAGLNYTPFSGRAATEAKMGEQLNQAASRLMGQNTPNINKAIRNASTDLGGKFDTTLRGTGVNLDMQLLNDLTAARNEAERLLPPGSFRPIGSLFDDLVDKGASGVIDGQAAYNIKRTLDRLGRGIDPNSWHALELKKVLMDGLNRSLGPAEAVAFATTRQQYGNMLAFEKLAKNGVEGEISVARLANMKNINNEPLQELADIAAQFVKAREGQHGSAQRALVGLGAGVIGGPASLAAGIGAGRATNMLLNSGAANRTLLGGNSNALAQLSSPELQKLILRGAPASSADR